MAAKKYISTKEAGEEIGRSARTIQDYCKEGRIEHDRFGRYYMIERRTWEEFKARHFRKAS
jgi:excisionase family DNA binding protein